MLHFNNKCCSYGIYYTFTVTPYGLFVTPYGLFVTPYGLFVTPYGLFVTPYSFSILDLAIFRHLVDLPLILCAIEFLSPLSDTTYPAFLRSFTSLR